MRPISRRVTAYKTPARCEYCGGEIWHGSAGRACIACGRREKKVALSVEGTERLLATVDNLTCPDCDGSGVASYLSRDGSGCADNYPCPTCRSVEVAQ